MACHVIDFPKRDGFDVYEFPWGTAVRDVANDKWVTIFLCMNAIGEKGENPPQEIDVTRHVVELDDYGIYFKKPPR